jgi:hypothetical protein
MGRTAHSRRVAEAWDRGRSVDCRQVYGQASAWRVGPDMEDFLRNHAAGIGAMAFLVESTINFRLLAVLNDSEA